MGTILHHICCICFTKNVIFDNRKTKNDIFISNLKKLSSATLFAIRRHTYVSNMGTLSKTMPQEWSYLGYLSRNLNMFVDDRPFCERIFWKFRQKSSLSFFLPSNTHQRIPCQRISFFEFCFTLLYFFQKTLKMAAVSIQWKGSNFSKLSTVLWYNH